MFVGLLVMCCQRYGLDYLSGRRGDMFLSLLGISLAITVALVGTFSRGEKPWSWPKTGLAYFGCWLATVFVIAILARVIFRPH